MSRVADRLRRVLAASVAVAFAGAAPLAPAQQASADLTPRLLGAAARIQAIDAQAARLGDYDELRNLQQTYGFYVDKALWDEVADLFADDGTLEVGQNGVFAGREAIRRYLYSLTGGRPGLLPGQLNNQFQLSPVITIAPNGLSAQARWRTLVQDGMSGAGSGGNWGSGVYENQYVRQDGRWKIRRAQLFLRFYAPYEGGWTRTTAQQNARFGATRQRPTRPPSQAYETFPAIFTAPYHYDNPARSDYRLVPAALSSGERPAPATGPAPSKTPTVSELEARVRALELRVERLQAVVEVERLENTYGYYADKSMQDAISALFAENSTLEILGRGVFIGRDRVYEYMRRLGAPTFGTLFNHMQLQPVVHVADDAQSAQVRARLFVMFGSADGRGAQWGEGVYENRFVREDGIWKYQNLNGFQTFYTNYEDGWAKKASGMFSPFAGYPPDLPQSVDYDPYPALFTPPFHYVHPVTGRPIPAGRAAVGGRAAVAK
jgi:hypothetical protein